MRDHDVVSNFDGEHGSSSRIGDGLTKGGASRGKDLRQSFRQISEGNLWGKQYVEARISEQAQGGGETAMVAPARTMRRRNASDLTGYQPKAAAVKRATKRRAHHLIAIPAHFKHGCFVSSQIQCGVKPVGRAAGMHDEVAIALRL